MRKLIRQSAVVMLLLGISALANAQSGPPAAPPPSPGGAAPGGTPLPAGGNITVQLPNYSPPSSTKAPSVNAHLPSSSRVSSNTSRSTDGFDLTRKAGGGKAVRGSATGAYLVSGLYTPELHTAKRGDTLWDISAHYFGNAYNWPRVWSFNKQIQNPHWIYPGDHIRLRGNYVRQVGLGVGFSKLKPLVSPATKFQRHVGYVLDGDHPVWGEVIGSPDDQMLLSENDEVYVQLDDKREYKAGQKLLIFEPREVKNLAKKPLVWIRGILQINRFNAKTRMARALIIESLDVIERGVKVGPYEKKIAVVAPKRNQETIQARIVGALYPFEFYGQNQVVLINKGSEDKVEIGNRFFAVSRGDQWRLGLHTAGPMADLRAITEDDRMARTEDTPDTDKPELYPAETYAELLVVKVRKHTATCLVTASIREISRGAVVIARKGY